MNIANLVNTRVAEIIKYQLQQRSNHLSSVESIEIEKERKSCMSYQTVLPSQTSY